MEVGGGGLDEEEEGEGRGVLGEGRGCFFLFICECVDALRNKLGV